MSKSIEELLRLARVVKNEDQEGQNTATRIGGLFEDIVEKLEDYYTKSEMDVTIINLTHRIEELERKVAYYHPEGVTLTVTPDKLTVGDLKQIEFNVICSTTAMRIMLYRYNADNDIWTEVYHEDDTATLRYQTSIAPTEAGIIKYKAVARIDTETDLVSNIVDVTVEDNKKTVQIGCGQDYAGVVFEDTGSKLVNNMPVTFVPNDGDYLFIKVDKNDTVRNLYTNPAQGPDYEIPIDGGTVDGDYKYYKSTIQVTAGNMNCKINKSL